MRKLKVKLVFDGRPWLRIVEVTPGEYIRYVRLGARLAGARKIGTYWYRYVPEWGEIWRLTSEDLAGLGYARQKLPGFTFDLWDRHAGFSIANPSPEVERAFGVRRYGFGTEGFWPKPPKLSEYPYPVYYFWPFEK